MGRHEGQTARSASARQTPPTANYGPAAPPRYTLKGGLSPSRRLTGPQPDKEHPDRAPADCPILPKRWKGLLPANPAGVFFLDAARGPARRADGLCSAPLPCSRRGHRRWPPEARACGTGLARPPTICGHSANRHSPEHLLRAGSCFWQWESAREQKRAGNSCPLGAYVDMREDGLRAT